MLFRSIILKRKNFYREDKMIELNDNAIEYIENRGFSDIAVRQVRGRHLDLRLGGRDGRDPGRVHPLPPPHGSGPVPQLPAAKRRFGRQTIAFISIATRG